MYDISYYGLWKKARVRGLLFKPLHILYNYRMATYTLFEVVITSIIVKDGKYLITRRSLSKKRFPGMWTLPGGHLEISDYTNSPKETADYWYNVLEKALRREVKEEVGLEIGH